MRAVFVVLTDPFSQDREQEYNDWYNGTHIPAILRLDGFVRASRWKLSGSRKPAASLAQRQYLALYELETDDLEASFAELLRANEAGDLGSTVGVLSTDAPALTAVFEHVASFER
jgi:hypothetical protein